MLKNIPLIIALSALLAACGGSDHKKTFPVSSSSSSTPSSSSSSSMDSSVASSVSSSSGATNKVLKIDVTNGSTVNWHVQLQQALSIGLDTTKTYTFSYRVKASAEKTIPILVTTGADDYVSYPTDMTDIAVTTEWQTKTLTIVPTTNDTTVFFQVNLGNNGEYQLWLDDISVTEVGGANEQITNGGIADDTSWTLGLNGGTGAGVLTVEDETPSSASSSSAASSSMASSSMASVINVDMTTGWRGNSGGAIAYSSDGVVLTGTADGQGAVFDIPAQYLEGAVMDFVINVDAAYKTSGQNLQPIAQLKGGGYPGEYDCWVNNSDLTPGTDQHVTCTISQGVVFNQTALDIQAGLQVKGTTFAGTVTIKSVTVTLP